MQAQQTTAAPASAPQQALQDILARLPEGISLNQVARVADIHVDALRPMLHGKRPVTPQTLGRLRLAVQRLRARKIDGQTGHYVAYRVLVLMAAQALGVDGRAVLAIDPGHKGRSPAQLAAAQVRWLAQYLLCVSFGLRQVEVARVAGVTKAAVSLAMQEIELKREAGSDFEKMLQALEADVVGEV